MNTNDCHTSSLRFFPPFFSTYSSVICGLSWAAFRAFSLNQPDWINLKRIPLTPQRVSFQEYGVNCWDISLERVWSYIDVCTPVGLRLRTVNAYYRDCPFLSCTVYTQVFAAGHFFGWVIKAVLVRHYGILWTISVMWEITEVAFAHLLVQYSHFVGDLKD